jgi:hypothetical protein
MSKINGRPAEFYAPMTIKSLEDHARRHWPASEQIVEPRESEEQVNQAIALAGNGWGGIWGAA